MFFSANYIIGMEAPFIYHSILSVASLADEYIILFNRSNGRTIDLTHLALREAGKPYLILRNDHIIGDGVDFAELRNRCLEASSGDYIIKVDADEVFYPGIERLRLVDIGEGCLCWFYHLVGDIYHSENCGKDIRFTRILCFRRDNFWVGGVHECLGKRFTPLDTNICYIHYSYIYGILELYRRWLCYYRLEGREIDFDYRSLKRMIRDRMVYYFNDHPYGILDEIEAGRIRCIRWFR